MDLEDSRCPPGALPLRQAMQAWLPEKVLADVRAAGDELNRNARQVYRIDEQGRRIFEIDAHSDFNRPLLLRVKEAQDAAGAAFLALLRAGRLVAWAREGSPVAPLRRIPADAWASLRLAHVTEGRARGHGVDLFGIHVAPAAEAAAAPPKPTLPPPGGWTLLQAAEALFPDLVEYCRGQENQREAFRRLSVTLGRAVLRERDDLTIAGHDLARGIDAPPVVVPRALYDDDTAPEGASWALDIWNSTFELRMPPPTPATVLRGVRILRLNDALRGGERTGTAHGPSLGKSGAPAEAPAGGEPKAEAAAEKLGTDATPPAALQTEVQPVPVHSISALRAWYLLRVGTWPASHPPPSEADDIAAAGAHFRRHIPRDSFRAIRRELAPEAWKRPGPRSKRA
ncbi:MAG: hypothetical protein ACK4PG_03195 [Acetobacteraceae bacterium]